MSNESINSNKLLANIFNIPFTIMSNITISFLLSKLHFFMLVFVALLAPFPSAGACVSQSNTIVADLAKPKIFAIVVQTQAESPYLIGITAYQFAYVGRLSTASFDSRQVRNAHKEPINSHWATFHFARDKL